MNKETLQQNSDVSNCCDSDIINFDELCKCAILKNSLSKPKKVFDGKKNLRRKENKEEHSFFLWNMFYIFFLPYVCRLKPVIDEDIPKPDDRDGSELSYNKTKDRWRTIYSKYCVELEKYEKEKSTDPKTTLTEPKKPGLLSVVTISLMTPSIIFAVFLETVGVASQLIQPFLMKEFLKELANKGIYETAKDMFPQYSDSMLSQMGIKIPEFPYGWAISIILCPFLHGFFDAWGVRLYLHFVGQFRSTLCTLVYNKTLHLNITAQSQVNTGRILSLISGDCRMLGEMMPMILMIAFIPIQICVPLIFVIKDFGLGTLIAFAVIFVMIPVQVIISSFFIRKRITYLFFNDERSKVTNETFQGIRVVKFSGLERVFTERVNIPRVKQAIVSGDKSMLFQFLSGCSRSMGPFVNAATIAFVIKTKKIEQENFVIDVVPTLAYLQQMTNPLGMFPIMIQAFVMLGVSINRVRDFLVVPELKEEIKEQPVDSNDAIVVKNGKFKWGDPPTIPLTSAEKQELKKKKKNHDIEMKTTKQKNEDSSPSPSPSLSPIHNKDRPTLQNINFKVPKGSLTMIIGGVGSGKSSIGSALIGDIDKLAGEIKISGSLAYCPQVAWINNNTVRENITFGMQYDETKYIETIKTCALEPDFKTLAAGDQTAIGEKGVNLSGGQKARIQLARAIYSDRDIYIMDDPLSAVDAHVGRHLFDECICGKLSKKTRILMTNQLQYLSSADNVILLNEGEIVAQGLYDELKERGIDFSEYIFKEEKEESNEEKDEKENKGEKTRDKEKDKKLKHQKKKLKAQEKMLSTKELGGDIESAAKQIITEEEQAKQNIEFSTYFRYIKKLFNLPMFILFILTLFIGEGCLSFSVYWMGKIGTMNEFKNISYWWKVSIYAFMGIGMLLFSSLRGFISKWAVKRSCIEIHNDLFNHVIRCPASFFDTTPMGRIINRFSGDLSPVDQMLFQMLVQVVMLWIQITGQVIAVSIDTVWFLAIGLPILVVYYFFLGICSRVSRNLQRLESISRSPVISLFGETVTGAGLSTIRAYKLEEEWKRNFYRLNDDWTVRYVLFWEGQKWGSFHASLITTLYMLSVILIGWYTMDVAKSAVAITTAFVFGSQGSILVQHNVSLDSNMTSLERIFFYSTKLPQEKDNKKISPDDNWPSKGEITFDNVTFRYRPGLPYVLEDVSFKLKGGEKVGVCGRTGAGKSSLLFALFRLIELDPSLEPLQMDIDTGMPMESKYDESPNHGRVLIDGVDISKVELRRLRSSIAIIPQDPTLFTGTVRYNLDLGSRCTDEEIWKVLDMIEMRQVITELPQMLDTQVAEGGSNFSCGQRQLLCFGRAILNKCRIVTMDEATASVDVETDAKIQNTIRNQFKEQTVIVIAHRLNTIINSDRILVMDSGRVVEFDTPKNLQNNPNSTFNGLLHSLTD